MAFMTPSPPCPLHYPAEPNHCLYCASYTLLEPIQQSGNGTTDQPISVYSDLTPSMHRGRTKSNTITAPIVKMFSPLHPQSYVPQTKNHGQNKHNFRVFTPLHRPGEATHDHYPDQYAMSPSERPALLGEGWEEVALTPGGDAEDFALSSEEDGMRRTRGRKTPKKGGKKKKTPNTKRSTTRKNAKKEIVEISSDEEAAAESHKPTRTILIPTMKKPTRATDMTVAPPSRKAQHVDEASKAEVDTKRGRKRKAEEDGDTSMNLPNNSNSFSDSDNISPRTVRKPRPSHNAHMVSLGSESSLSPPPSSPESTRAKRPKRARLAASSLSGEEIIDAKSCRCRQCKKDRDEIVHHENCECRACIRQGKEPEIEQGGSLRRSSRKREVLSYAE